MAGLGLWRSQATSLFGRARLLRLLRVAEEVAGYSQAVSESESKCERNCRRSSVLDEDASDRTGFARMRAGAV
jgi:hypothetical protein